MASLQSYSVHGNRYWRIVESFRDKRGRPRIRVVRHLGTAQKLLECLSEAPGRPLYAEERDFGATAALWDTAQQLDIVRTIDTHARKRNQGPSVGEYLLLAALNRALAPASKRKLGAWYRNTILVPGAELAFAGRGQRAVEGGKKEVLAHRRSLVSFAGMGIDRSNDVQLLRCVPEI